MDELAKLYINDDGRAYRIKVFENMIGIERQQPHGDNRFYDRTDPQIYDGHAWNWQAIGSLIARYEYVQAAHDAIDHFELDGHGWPDIDRYTGRRLTHSRN